MIWEVKDSMTVLYSILPGESPDDYRGYLLTHLGHARRTMNEAMDHLAYLDKIGPPDQELQEFYRTIIKNEQENIRQLIRILATVPK